MSDTLSVSSAFALLTGLKSLGVVQIVIVCLTLVIFIGVLLYLVYKMRKGKMDASIDHLDLAKHQIVLLIGPNKEPVAFPLPQEADLQGHLSTLFQEAKRAATAIKQAEQAAAEQPKPVAPTAAQEKK